MWILYMRYDGNGMMFLTWEGNPFAVRHHSWLQPIHVNVARCDHVTPQNEGATRHWMVRPSRVSPWTALCLVMTNNQSVRLKGDLAVLRGSLTAVLRRCRTLCH